MTIEVPTPSTELLNALETTTIEVKQSEAAAVAAIREKFGVYAKYNGYIKTAWSYRGNANWSEQQSAYYKHDGRKVKALLAWDGFSRNNSSEFAGEYTGERLYLTESGEWLVIERVGYWSEYQGSPEEWYCDKPISEPTDGNWNDFVDAPHPPPAPTGSIRKLTDQQVAAGYELDVILEQLAKTMVDMCAKLPERHARLKARAELAQRAVASLA